MLEGAAVLACSFGLATLMTVAFDDDGLMGEKKHQVDRSGGVGVT